MVIREKALVSQLKKDYSGAGYHVAVPEEGEMILTGNGWAVKLEGGNTPREVLSLIVKHMGFLPGCGTAWLISKGKKEPLVQKELPGIVLELEPVAGMEKAEGGRAVNRTGLSFMGRRVWQCTDGLKILLMEPGRESLLDDFESVTAAGCGLYKEGKTSAVYIRTEADGLHPEQLKHLEAMQWIG